MILTFLINLSEAVRILAITVIVIPFLIASGLIMAFDTLLHGKLDVIGFLEVLRCGEVS